MDTERKPSSALATVDRPGKPSFKRDEADFNYLLALGGTMPNIRVDYDMEDTTGDRMPENCTVIDTNKLADLNLAVDVLVDVVRYQRGLLKYRELRSLYHSEQITREEFKEEEKRYIINLDDGIENWDLAEKTKTLLSISGLQFDLDEISYIFGCSVGKVEEALNLIREEIQIED